MVYLNGLASDVLRDLPLDIMRVWPDNYDDILFVVPHGYVERWCKQDEQALKADNICLIDTGDSMAGYITALNTCDAVITADTSTYHLAAALQKPALVLFGPVGSRLRTAYYPHVQALDAHYTGRTCRSPCGKSMYSEFYGGHIDGEKRCPEAVSCKMSFSPCLASFDSEKLIDAFESILF